MTHLRRRLRALRPGPETLGCAGWVLVTLVAVVGLWGVGGLLRP